jgi:ankyrin repeat protein
LEVVQLLLSDLRVDPSAENDYAIKWASNNGHLEVVQLLLSDPRVDPSTNDNAAIRWASGNGHLEVVQLLLSDTRVNPSAMDNYAIQLASEKGHLEVVQLLLSDARVDPSANDNYAIQLASGIGHRYVIVALLNHSKVDPNAAVISEKTPESLRRLIQVARDLHGINSEELQKLDLSSLSADEWDMLMQRKRNDVKISLCLLKKQIQQYHLPGHIMKQPVWEQVLVLLAKHGPVSSQALRGRLLPLMKANISSGLTGVAEIDCRIFFQALRS